MPDEPTTENCCNTTPKQRGGCTGKGFVKGDPRINRNGRPKSFDEFRRMAQELSHQIVTCEDGQKATLAEAILRRCSTSEEPALVKLFVETAFGKVPDKMEVSGLTGLLVVKQGHQISQEQRLALTHGDS